MWVPYLTTVAGSLAKLGKRPEQPKYETPKSSGKHGEMGAKAYAHRGIALEDLHGGLVRLEHVPVVHTSLGDEANRALADPLPVNNVLVCGCRIQLGLLLEVEDLECPGLGPQGNDGTRPVHDGTVGLDAPAHDIAEVLEVDDDDFGRCGLVLLFANADVPIGL